MKKNLSDSEKKDIGESVQKNILWNANYDRKNNAYTKRFTSTSFKRCEFKFDKFLKTLFDMLDTSLPVDVRFFPKYFFINYASSYRKI